MIVTVGIVMLLVGVGFKLAVVPFHMWTPDVYQGAPAPVGAYVATVSKGAVFALLLRYFRPVSLDPGSTLFLVFAAVAIASMVAGNLLALRQDNVKRILAYSSIAHLGYLLVAFLASGERAAIAVTFYLVAYFATTLAAFGVITVLSPAGRDADLMLDYRGLGARRPVLAAIFAVALFSLAGMPLTMGFIGKFYLVTAGAGSALWALVIVLVVTSTIGLYYYTRLIVAMYVRRPGSGRKGTARGSRRRRRRGRRRPRHPHRVPSSCSAVYPTPLLRLVEHAVSTLPLVSGAGGVRGRWCTVADAIRDATGETTCRAGDGSGEVDARPVAGGASVRARDLVAGALGKYPGGVPWPHPNEHLCQEDRWRQPRSRAASADSAPP